MAKNPTNRIRRARAPIVAAIPTKIICTASILKISEFYDLVDFDSKLYYCLEVSFEEYSLAITLDIKGGFNNIIAKSITKTIESTGVLMGMLSTFYFKNRLCRVVKEGRNRFGKSWEERILIIESDPVDVNIIYLTAGSQ